MPETTTGSIRCPAPHELTRAFSEGADRALEHHLADCDACAASWRDLGRVRDVCARLDVPRPSAASRAYLRERVLACEVAPAGRRAGRRSPTRWLAVAAVLAAAAVAVYALWPRPSLPARERAAVAIVVPRGVADYRVERSERGEVVWLADGVVEVDAARGREVRVRAPDAELELRGAAMVRVASGRLHDVDVRRGAAVVRTTGGADVHLDAGTSWSPPAPAIDEVIPPAAPAPPAPAPAIDAERVVPARPAPTPPAASARPAATPTAFSRGMTALRTGEFDTAAAAFGASLADASEARFAEDAAYWRAVALGRVKDSGGAIAAYREFLRRFPASSRRAEASAALGWLLIEAGDTAAAERALQDALSSSVPRVRRSAEAGLDALEGR